MILRSIWQQREPERIEQAGKGRLVCVLLMMSLLLTPTTVCAAELLMFTRKACPYCVLWERQIGPIYPKTAEAIIAPLRRIDVERPAVDAPALNPPVTITPTFVVMDGDREIGRFAGYSDDLSFWSALSVHLAKIPATSPSTEVRKSKALQ